ncbi:MAG TPA: zinc ribbon domain-containing protein [Anaerolineales bacterium]
MEIGSIFLILALLILVGLFIARPIFERKAVPVVSLEDHELSGLLAERDRILTALQELDFDHALGKIPAEDYPLQRAGLLRRGADLLRQIDEFGTLAPEGDFEARIETAIAARRADAAPVGDGAGGRGPRTGAPAGAGLVTVVDDELEARLAARRRERQDRSAGFCPQCGRPVQKSDRFCPKCGAALA